MYIFHFFKLDIPILFIYIYITKQWYISIAFSPPGGLRNRDCLSITGEDLKTQKE